MSQKDLLANSPIFRGFGPQELAAIEAICQPCDLAAGDTLFAAGSAATAVYIVVLGTLEMTVPGRDKRFARFGTGQVFGLAALVLDEGYPGSTVAVENCKLVKIPTAALEALFAKNAALAAKFYKSVAHHLAFHARGMAAELERPYF
jgi:SulP family sulfate permease